MKRNSTFVNVILCATLALPHISLAQFTPGLPAAFGIDGDGLSGQSQNIPGNTPLGSFDWFRKTGSGSDIGYGVIDTTGTYIYNAPISSGQNVTFTRGMAFSRYSTQSGYLLLDARYARDNFGYSSAAGQKDFTTFTGGAKNGDNPTTWTTTPSGATVSDKADIIDTYIHMRRDGIIINNTNPSALILTMGVSTVGNTGNRYVDFELYRTRIEYNGITGIFSNSGPVSSGGHSAWDFNADGTVKEIGDMTVSFSYGTLGVEDISVHIWVSQANFNSVSPTRFNFVPGEFYGSTYGYAKIIPLSASAFKAWGTSSTANTNGPVWGTNSKSLGSSPNNYYSANYAAYDFGEIGLDLTSMGIDPALSVGMNPCVPPFTRVIAKTRSSSSFTSSLQDFSGSYEFLDAPQVPAQIVAPAVLKCNQTTTTLSPAAPVDGAVYQWSTTNGNIVSDPNTITIVVDKPGKYYLAAAIVAGCPTNIDSTIVSGDFFQPVATASVSGMIVTGNPASTVVLIGGDAVQSNQITPFGGSAGLDWNWTGPNGFTSNNSSATTGQIGNYTLVLTELRNGCKDTAEVLVQGMSAPLPVKYFSFDAVVSDKTVLLTWVTNTEINKNHFEVERSFDGSNFKTIGLVLDPLSIAAGKKTYKIKDNSIDLQGKTIAYYRLKQIDSDGKYTYSSVLVVRLQSQQNNVTMSVAPNPFVEKITIRFDATENGIGEMRIMKVTGQTVLSKQANISKGYNNLQVEGLSKMNAGVYIVQLLMNGTVIDNQKIVKN